ncbi:unnamed protein product, partial [Iphiclides podalirius]
MFISLSFGRWLLSSPDAVYLFRAKICEKMEDNRNKSGKANKRKMKGEKRRNYDSSRFKESYMKVIKDNWSVYKASKEYGIPWSTLRRHIATHGGESFDLPKLGRPFTLDSDLECKFVSYIIKMQELGFGLSVTDIKAKCYGLAVQAGKDHQFNDAKRKAGPYWWWSFKERYGLSLRTPEKLAACRPVTANRQNIDDFYKKLLDVVIELDILRKPERINNCDETGVTFVVKPSKIVTQTGKKARYLTPQSTNNMDSPEENIVAISNETTAAVTSEETVTSIRVPSASPTPGPSTESNLKRKLPRVKVEKTPKIK